MIAREGAPRGSIAMATHAPIYGRGKGFGAGKGKGGFGGGKGYSSGDSGAAAPGTKVYVGNLSWETSWQDLKDHFRQAGEVTHADVIQSADGRSKGCGLVTFSTAREAANAISTLHDSVLHSRAIFVREDREAALPGLPAPPQVRGAGVPVPALPRAPPPRAPTTTPSEPGARVFINNLAFETSWQDLKDHFRQAGEVVHADVMMGQDGRSKGCGMVTFATAREAANAIQSLNSTSINGRVIYVREDREAVRRRRRHRRRCSCPRCPRCFPPPIPAPPPALPRSLTLRVHACVRGQALPGLPAPASRSSPAGPVGSGGAAPPPFAGGLPPARAAAAPPLLGRPGGAGAGPPGAQAGAGAPATAGTKVYVGNLAWETSWQDLKDHFRAVGDVLHADVMMGPDGRSRGCGLVAFATPEQAAAAISTLHDSVLHSRSIFVREDREAGHGIGEGGGGKGGFGGGGKGSGKGYGKGEGGGSGCQVFVGNLPWDVAWQVWACLPGP